MECEACGSRNVTRRGVEGYLLEECNLCGALQGDDEAVARVEELRAGRERGLEEDVIPLVSVLEQPGCFHVQRASVDPPAVLFTLVEDRQHHVERLVRSIEMANRKTRLHWLIELSLQHSLVYILRPRFWKPPDQITAAELGAAGEDLRLLARFLRRDLSLRWWRE